jgi:hypothetical protein
LSISLIFTSLLLLLLRSVVTSPSRFMRLANAVILCLSVLVQSAILEGILINNIAWLLRRFPLFAVPGSGDYQIQPVFAEDVAEMAVNAGHQDHNAIIDAVGPETFTFNELVRLIASRINSRAGIVHVRPRLAYWLARLIGGVVRDVVITRDEIDGLMSNLLISQTEPTAPTRFSVWLEQNADKVGRRYISGLERRYR